MKKKFNVLYAEDEEFVNSALTSFLVRHPLIEKVDSAKTGQEALDKIKFGNRYDLLITDINMPGINGYELIKQAKEYQVNIYTIITSAYNDSEYLLNAANSSIDSYLVKPIMLNELSSKIENIFLKDKKKKIENEDTISKAINNEKLITSSNLSQQWRDPLTIISLEIQTLLENKRSGNISDEDMIKRLEFLSETTNKLSQRVEEV